MAGSPSRLVEVAVTVLVKLVLAAAASGGGDTDCPIPARYAVLTATLWPGGRLVVKVTVRVSASSGTISRSVCCVSTTFVGLVRVTQNWIVVLVATAIATVGAQRLAAVPTVCLTPRVACAWLAVGHHKSNQPTAKTMMARP